MRSLKISGKASRSRSNLAKYNPHHDSRGRFASGTGGGGSGLSHQDIFNNLDTKDSLKQSIYKAEEKLNPELQRTVEKPFPPNRADFEDGTPLYLPSKAYNKAYAEYSKKFNEYKIESTRNVQSELGLKTLDGSRAGVQKYVNTVSQTDWFKKEFGDGGRVGIPKVIASNNMNTAGSYQIGMKGGQGYSALKIDRGYTKAEPLIIHEISHFATAISATSKFQGHGVEFAKNHIFIASKIIGDDYAASLANAYRGEGIDLGD